LVLDAGSSVPVATKERPKDVSPAIGDENETKWLVSGDDEKLSVVSKNVDRRPGMLVFRHGMAIVPLLIDKHKVPPLVGIKRTFTLRKAM
jgi:hypothetical protein